MRDNIVHYLSEDVYMNMEEIVTLSVKHNVSDSHLRNARSRDGANKRRMDRALPRQMSTGFLLDWLNDAQQYQWRTHGQLDFAVSLAGTRACAPVRSHINRERRWRYGYCPSVVPIRAETMTPPIVPRTACQRERIDLWSLALLVAGSPPRWRRWTSNQHADKHTS